MSDILEGIDIHLVCPQCNASYDVSAAVVAESQEILKRGCPGTGYECPASVFAQVVDRDALRALARAWEQVEQSAQVHSGELVLRLRPRVEGSTQPVGVSAVDAWANEGGALHQERVDRAALRALARWENEGGAVPHQS